MIVFVEVVAAAVAIAAVGASAEDLVLADGGLRASLAATTRCSSQRGHVNTCSIVINICPTMSYI
jgi:hypothetical protein